MVALVGAAVTGCFLVVACGFLVAEDVFLAVVCGFLAVCCGVLAVVRRTAELFAALPALTVGRGCETAADDTAAAVEPCVVTTVTPAVLSKTNAYEPFDDAASAFGR